MKRVMLEDALKRVCAVTGLDGKLYNDNTGWFVIWKGTNVFRESSMSATELLRYLHGIEDCMVFMNKK